MMPLKSLIDATNEAVEKLPLPMRARLLRAWYRKEPDRISIGASLAGPIGGRGPLVLLLGIFMVGPIWIALMTRSSGLSELMNWALALMSSAAALCGMIALIWGKVEVRIMGDVAKAFVGIGSIGWCSCFKPTLVRNIALVNKGKSIGEGNILIEGDVRIAFGKVLSIEQRRFMVMALRDALGMENRTV